MIPLIFSFENSLAILCFLKMFLTNILMKKIKSKYVKVVLRSIGSPHQRITFRERLDDKKEEIFFDPIIDRLCLYKEEKKLPSKHIPMKKNYKGVHKPKEI